MTISFEQGLVKASMGGTLKSTEGLAIGSAPSKLEVTKTITTGTGADKANNVYTASVTLAAAATTTFDLFGTLENIYGVQIDGAKLKGLQVHNKTLTTGDKLEIGGNAGGKAIAGLFAALTDKLYCPPGGIVQVYNPVDGVTIATGTADELEVKNVGANPVSYDIVLLFET